MSERIVNIPAGSVVSHQCVEVGLETPLGVMPGWTTEIAYNGRRYHVLTQPDNGDGLPAIDIGNGDVVRLRYPPKRKKRG